MDLENFCFGKEREVEVDCFFGSALEEEKGFDLRVGRVGHAGMAPIEVLSLADLGGIAWMQDRSEWEVEVRLEVGVGRVEVGDFGVEKFCEREVGFADAVNDAAGEFVGSVAVEVGVVADGGGLAGEGVRGVVHEGSQRAFGAHRFEQGFAHGVEIDEGDFLLRGNFADGVGVGTEGVRDLAGVVEGSAIH